ncbi:MAG: hypothetical protein NC548_30960 [Lachnospiraceae bacterium]|nr:hypothetical protein [Lachnospiraceae bacterium]
MDNIKSFSEFLNEAKSIEYKIKQVARHLAFDKDVIKYLNTSRSKREMGWRDLLDTKLRAGDKEYINYITKQMVSDLNNTITGPISVKVNDGDFDNNKDEISRFNGIAPEDKMDDLNKRLKDVEDTLGIDPDDKKSLDKVKKKAEKLGFDVIDDKDKEDEEEE